VVSVLWLQGILENQIAASSAQYQQLQQQLQAVERNRTDLEASWLHNRRLNHAARVIQRRYRVWRSRTHVAKFGRDAEVCCLILLRVSCEAVCLSESSREHSRLCTASPAVNNDVALSLQNPPRLKSISDYSMLSLLHSLGDSHAVFQDDGDLYFGSKPCCS